MDSGESERIVVAARLERIAVVLERMVCLLEDVHNIMLTGDDVALTAQENVADSPEAPRDVPSAGDHPPRGTCSQCGQLLTQVGTCCPTHAVLAAGADERVGKWLRDAGYKRLGFPGVATW